MLSGSELWLLRLMADRGVALLDASGLLVIMEQRGELQVAASAGETELRVRLLPVEGSALGVVYRAARPLALDSPRGADAAWLHELGITARAILVEPLSMGASGSGMIIALRERGRFRDPDRDALHAFAGSVAQRLVAERSVEIERLRHGLEARERERKRWARELHDETVQGLGALRLMLANARDRGDDEQTRKAVDAVLEGLGAEIDGLRHLITELRPAALDDLGLAPALHALARRAQAIDGLDVTTRIELGDGTQERLDSEAESTIYRVVQEALTNVSRHADASAATVAVVRAPGSVNVEVSDDGRGLPPQLRSGGFGVAGMRERAELLGTELQLRARPGGGTTVTLRVPLDGRVPPSSR